MIADKRKRIRFIVPPLIVLGGLVIFAGMTLSRKKPQRTETKVVGALVEVMTAEQTTRPVIIEATGTVRPRYEVNVIPQVSGRVEWVHPDLEAGGVFQEGEVMARVERADYELALQQAEAAVAQTEYMREIVVANAAIAREEWGMLNGDEEGVEPDALVLHEPQLRQAEANVASAEAVKERAELNLSRTVLSAPFNCRVRRTSLAPGQVVGPQGAIATVYATDLVEIEVGLTLDEIEWLNVPGSEVELSLSVNHRSHVWEGRIDRSVGVLDELGRLAKVMVQVDRPYDQADGEDLSIGSFVHLKLYGREAENIVPVPRRAVHERNHVWIANGEDKLEIRKVDISRLNPKEAFVTSGLVPGDRIILTSLSGAATGMPLRTVPVEKTIAAGEASDGGER